MHIITGLVAGALIGRRRGSRQVLPPVRTGPVRVLHAVPGRIRLGVPSLVSSSGAARKEGRFLEDKLPRLEGVRDVRVTPVTGSVVVRYEPDEVEPILVLAAVVRLLGLDEEFDRPRDPVLRTIARDLGTSANRLVYERSGGLVDLWTLLLLAGTVYGVRRLIEAPSSRPAGLTLLWWSLHSLLGRRSS